MQSLDHDTVTAHIAAPPEVVYELVADVTRMPEFSPEILRCRWLDGATGPAVGARFAARNKVPRRPPWTNKPVVTLVDPGRAFVVSRTEILAGTVEWSYRFEAQDGGTKVTESYLVTRPLSRFGWFLIGTLFGRKDRRSDLRAGMQQTLERMREVAERPTRTNA
ncbi:MAG TPA: SRPBCC family protein [Acidimicrobiales bacterium]|nr:SRPBCC family protein [Acidimicrobiales bacterium]